MYCTFPPFSVAFLVQSPLKLLWTRRPLLLVLTPRQLTQHTHIHSCIAVYKTQPYDDINLTMTMPIKIWSIQIIVVLLFKLLWCQYVFGLPTTPDPFKGDVKVEDTKKVKNTNSTKGILQAGVDNGGVGATPLSTAAESVITFVSVFIVGCVITLSVYSWKRFKPSKGWG